MPDYPMGVQYDEQGRPFTYVGGTSRRSYISPVAFGGQKPEDTTGIFRQGPQWNQNSGEWETPIDWGNILAIGTGAGLGAGALSAAGAFGGAAGGLSESVIPTSMGTTGAGLPSASMMGALPASQIAPAAGTLPAGGAGLSQGGGMLSGLTGQSWLGPALSLGTGLAGRLMNQGGGNMVQPPPQLQQLLDEATRRTMNQAPLSDAITRQALAGLPNYAR